MRKEYDLAGARRARDVPHLAKIQSSAGGKSRITIMLDNDLLAIFRARADAEGIGYQTLINRALRESIGHAPVDEHQLRHILREELAALHKRPNTKSGD